MIKAIMAVDDEGGISKNISNNWFGYLYIFDLKRNI